MGSLKLWVSDLDTARWGVKTIQARGDVSAAVVDDFMRDSGAGLAIVRINTDDIGGLQKFEARGYRLMDTLLYWSFPLAKCAKPEFHPVKARPMDRVYDAETVTEIATQCFQGYFGHYHADPRLTQADCDAVYVDWAIRSIRDPKIEIMVAEDHCQIIGYMTVTLNSPEEAEVVVGGVLPEHQSKGAYRQMFLACLQWAREHGAERLIVSTQITNKAVQKVWARLGGEFAYAYYTLHKWANDSEETMLNVMMNGDHK